jgi:lipoprotein NlpD
MNRNIVCVIATFLLVACSGNRNDRYESPEVVIVKKKNPYHTVAEGETVGDVANMYSMTRAEVIKLNDLRPPYQLYAGQRLLIRINVDGGVPQTDTCSVRLIDSNPVDNTQEQDATEISEQKAMSESAEPANEYEWPVAGAKERITQRFEEAGSDGGIIIDASAGTPVRAISDGMVIISGVPDGDAAVYGLTVAIKHADGKVSIYSNLQESTVKVKDKVKKGAIIGKVGKSGAIAKKAQLYFELRAGNKSIDPEGILP